MSDKKKRDDYDKNPIFPVGEQINVEELKRQRFPNIDKRRMFYFLVPFLIILQRYKVTVHCFVQIFKSFKIQRDDIFTLIKMLEAISLPSKTSINEVISRERELKHTTAPGKDVILSYHACIDPDGFFTFLKSHITKFYQNLSNKDVLLNKLKHEIEDVQREKNLFLSQQFYFNSFPESHTHHSKEEISTSFLPPPYLSDNNIPNNFQTDENLEYFSDTTSSPNHQSSSSDESTYFNYFGNNIDEDDDDDFNNDFDNYFK